MVYAPRVELPSLSRNGARGGNKLRENIDVVPEKTDTKNLAEGICGGRKVRFSCQVAVASERTKQRKNMGSRPIFEMAVVVR